MVKKGQIPKAMPSTRESKKQVVWIILRWIISPRSDLIRVVVRLWIWTRQRGEDICLPSRVSE
jgi:hypothetical protein